MTMRDLILKPTLVAAAALGGMLLIPRSPALAQGGDAAGPSSATLAQAAEDTRPRGLVSREELIEDRLRRLGVLNPDPAPRHPTSRADSLDWERHRRAAENADGLHIVVSLFDRRLWLMDGQDTLLATAAGVGMGLVRRGSRVVDFSTPRGTRVVLAKEENPLWIPPDWHYWEMYSRVRQFPAGGVQLSEGGRLIRRGENLGILRGTDFEILPREHPLVFDGVMYIPPFGTINRAVPEVLGAFKLDLGDGYLIHGTNDPLAIGFPATHGCIRLDDEPLEQLFGMVDAGTPVYIY